MFSVVVVFVVFVCFVVDDGCFFMMLCCGFLLLFCFWLRSYLLDKSGKRLGWALSDGPRQRRSLQEKLWVYKAGHHWDSQVPPPSPCTTTLTLCRDDIWDPKQKTAHFTNAKKQMTTILSFWYYLHFSPQLLYADLLILYNTDFPREIMLIRISERFTHDPIFTFALTKGGCHQRAATAFSLEYESSTSAVQIYSHWNIFLARKTIYVGSPFPHSWKGNCNLMLGIFRKQKPLYLYPVKTFQIKCVT